MSKVNIPNIELADGNKLPILGFGTSDVNGNDFNDAGCQAIIHAIKSGYRFIDTAALYRNEEGVALAVEHCIKEGIVKREDLYICTKVWCTAHKRETVMKACRESLKRLKMDYIDLYLIHWPVAYQEDGDPINPIDPKTGKPRYSNTPVTETWKGMEDVKDAGLSRSIGVSNFNHLMTDEIFAICKHRPVVNQVECHAYLSQEKLHQYSKKNNIILNAYCPIGSPGSSAKEIPKSEWVMNNSLVQELAKKHNKSSAQILLRYLIQRNIPPIPKSVTPKRIEENLEVFDFQISNEDMDRLMKINKNLRYCTTTGGYDVSDPPIISIPCRVSTNQTIYTIIGPSILFGAAQVW